MPISPINQNEIFASDLLGTGINADTLDGLDSDSFLRRDDHALPSVNNTWDLGNDDFKWRRVFAYSGYFDYLQASNVDLYHYQLKDIGTYTHNDIDKHINATKNIHGATPYLTNNTLVQRDTDGNIWVNMLYGTAVQSRYADLAEKYTCEHNNNDILIGTVIKISKNQYDVEICNDELSNEIIGIKSETPSFLMNKDIDGVTVGLKGKLLVRIIGKINKGDIIVSAGNGCARKANNETEKSCFKIGYSTETNNNENEKLIMCII